MTPGSLFGMNHKVQWGLGSAQLYSLISYNLPPKPTTPLTIPSTDPVCVCILVAHLCPSLWDPMDCSPPGSSVHGIFQVRILEWVAIPFCRGSSQPRDQIWVSCIEGRFFTI